MNIKITSLGLAGLLFVTACSNDEVKLLEADNEISFNTCVSRATVTTTDNLNAFKVWAISQGFGNKIIDGKDATRQTGTSYFKMPVSVFWPHDVTTLDVFAVAPSTTPTEFNDNGPIINNFTPKSDLSQQEDLIVAYTAAKRSEGTNISLQFNHALSQIEVQATKAADNNDGTDTETKNVIIKGAWIVNVCSKGNLAFDKNESNYMNWAELGTKTIYGTEFTNPKTLDHTNLNLLASSNNNTNMLLIPQELDTWNLDSDTDKSNNSSSGAYILVLCRVEAEHDGTTHDGDDAIDVDETKKTHKHQLFPYTKHFDADEYGYSCVPINTKWEPGKKYVYKLSFCGVSSGAGVYPPVADLNTLPDGNGKYIKFGTEGHSFPDAPKKGVGDPVLDNPITFSVTVNSWDAEVNEGKNMN